MKLTLNAVYSRIRLILTDPDHVRWTKPEIRKWVFDGQREIAAACPSAVAETVTVRLEEGARQTLPDDALLLIDAPTNATGEAIALVSRELMDSQNYRWRNRTRPATIVRHAMIDPSNPRVFEVYPPSDGDSEIDLVVARLPKGKLQLDSRWLPAIVDYCLFRAYGKDAEFAGNGQIAASYYQAFAAGVSGADKSAVSNNPNLANEPRHPSVPVTLSR